MSDNAMVDRLVARLKSSPLGDLVTEEDLKDVCKDALQKAFFEKRLSPGTGWNSGPGEKEPLVVEVMREAMRAEVSKQVTDWTAANQSTLTSYWKTVLDKGLVEYVQTIQRDVATSHLRDALSTYFNSINDERMRNGERPLPVPAL